MRAYGASRRAGLMASILLAAAALVPNPDARAVPTTEDGRPLVRSVTRQGRSKWRRGAQPWYVMRAFAAARQQGVRNFDAWLVKTGRTSLAHVANKRLRRANRGRRV